MNFVKTWLKILAMVAGTTAIFISIGLLAHQMITPLPTPAKIEYRWYGDKAKPDDWMQKYSVPMRYYVWVDDVGTYQEVTKEEYDSVPSGKSLPTRKR